MLRSCTWELSLIIENKPYYLVLGNINVVSDGSSSWDFDILEPEKLIATLEEHLLNWLKCSMSYIPFLTMPRHFVTWMKH